MPAYPGPMKVERWSPFKVWLFSLGSRKPARSLAAVEWFDPGPDDSLLDIGCGLGTALQHAAETGARVAGVEPSPTMVTKSRMRVPTAEVKEGSAEAIPFDDASFSGAMAVATFHHWADRSAGLTEVLRVLQPGGRFLVMERQLKRPKGHGLHPDEAQSLAAELERHGFVDTRVEPKKVETGWFLMISARKPD